MGQHGAAGLEQKGREVTFLLEDRYQDENLPEGITKEARDLLIFLHLVHELTEWRLTESTETISPNFNRELVAIVAQAMAYYALTEGEREEVLEAARLFDEQEQGFDDRYGPVLDLFNQFDKETILAEENREKLRDFIDRYHDFDKNDYDAEKVEEYFKEMQEQMVS
ncbi:hypothetical protein ACFL28_05575, partial [Candidatus Omnitrophota bacterium]